MVIISKDSAFIQRVIGNQELEIPTFKSFQESKMRNWLEDCISQKDMYSITTSGVTIYFKKVPWLLDNEYRWAKDNKLVY
jgi:hypothetical protein